ncbi:MAG: guanylate kinase, partial [Eubacterium sp.]|nr:guanylate kinase [Eubacterium sp.]
YIEVDDGIRLGRALKRERKQNPPGYAEMCRRFLADQEDFSEEKIVRAGITKRYLNNGAMDICVDEIAEAIQAARNMV